MAEIRAHITLGSRTFAVESPTVGKTHMIHELGFKILKRLADSNKPRLGVLRSRELSVDDFISIITEQLESNDSESINLLTLIVQIFLEPNGHEINLDSLSTKAEEITPYLTPQTLKQLGDIIAEDVRKINDLLKGLNDSSEGVK